MDGTGRWGLGLWFDSQRVSNRYQDQFRHPAHLKFNSSHQKIGRAPKENSSSNHHLSGAMLNFRGVFAIPLHIFAGDESPSKGANGGTAGCGWDSLSSPCLGGWKHQKTWEANWNPASKASDFVKHFPNNIYIYCNWGFISPYFNPNYWRIHRTWHQVLGPSWPPKDGTNWDESWMGPVPLSLVRVSTSHRIHGTGRFPHIWLIFMVNVGKCR